MLPPCPPSAAEYNWANDMGRRLTGSIWKLAPRSRAQQVRRTCEALEQTYGRPRLGNPRNPLDDLVFIILSNKTAPQVARRTYLRAKRRFPAWDDVLKARPATLERVLRPAGLSRVKARQIRGALEKISRDQGKCTLRHLKKTRPEQAQKYLEELPGVSTKVAKCVLMYTTDAEVLPVDSHVFRVATRLGWTRRNRAAQCHDELEALVPAGRRYTFHVDAVTHGRAVCRPTAPLCDVCCISRYCDYYREKYG